MNNYLVITSVHLDTDDMLKAYHVQAPNESIALDGIMNELGGSESDFWVVDESAVHEWLITLQRPGKPDYKFFAEEEEKKKRNPTDIIDLQAAVDYWHTAHNKVARERDELRSRLEAIRKAINP